MRRISLFIVAVVFASCVGLDLRADSLTGPVYPPPGGVTFTAGASRTGDSGGKTNTYSGLDPSQYTHLYWGPSYGNSTAVSTRGSSSDTVSYSAALSDLADGKLVMTGSTQLSDAVTGLHTVYTEFVVSVTDASNNPLAFTTTDSLSGFPSSASPSPAVAAITGTSFKVNLQALGSYTNGSGYVAINDLYNAAHTSGSQVVTSFNGGFFADAPSPATDPNAAPLPSPVWGAATLLGAVGVVRVARRRNGVALA